MSATADTLLAKLHAANAEVTVVGLGYVGLTLGVALARGGFRVHGIDVDLEKVSLVNRGTSYLDDVATDELTALVKDGRLDASTTYDAVPNSDAIVICVPTPLRKSKEPDISFILSAIES